MASPYEWRIDSIEATANRADRRLHEIDSLRSEVSHLETQLREARSEAESSRIRLETLEYSLDQLRDEVRSRT